MELNYIFFPSPDCDSKRYDEISKLDELIWIPKSNPKLTPKMMSINSHNFLDVKFPKVEDSIQELDYIPCLYFHTPGWSEFILIYFHGNAEDIGIVHSTLLRLHYGLNVTSLMDVLGVEYPGYSLYDGNPSADEIMKDAEIIYDFLNLEVGIPQDKIILFGRSMGSGPATFLASKKEPRALILMSPYISIKTLVRDSFGEFLHYFVAERFKNLDMIEDVSCPILFLHGKLDELIPIEHSRALKNAAKSSKSYLKILDSMTHNFFVVSRHLIDPLTEFFEDEKIEYAESQKDYIFPTEVFVHRNGRNGSPRNIIARYLVKLITVNAD